MIYVKKPDNTIQQFGEEDDMMRRLHIDKEIAAQAGEEFGEIHTAESLPDEDKVKVGLMTRKEYDAKLLVFENQKKLYDSRQYLADTDYKIIKEMELGEACPDEVKLKRAECRKIINELQGA